jgi:hypothetical protein
MRLCQAPVYEIRGLAQAPLQHLSIYYIVSDMKYLQLTGLILCAVSFAGCETTQNAGSGNTEVKRIAALNERRQEEAHMDESQKNLWNAQQDILNRDGDPTVRPTP